MENTWIKRQIRFAAGNIPQWKGNNARSTTDFPYSTVDADMKLEPELSGRTPCEWQG